MPGQTSSAYVRLKYTYAFTRPAADSWQLEECQNPLLLGACRQVQPGWLLGSGSPTLWSCASCLQMGAPKLCTLGTGSPERCLQPT